VEYFRERCNKIQAGFALHCAKLLKQYLDQLEQLAPDEQYEGTLAITVLQSLLTTCSELRRVMEERRKRDFRAILGPLPDDWGLQRDFIKQDTFPKAIQPKAGRVLEHLRNALSHPTFPTSFDLPSTGFTTVVDGSNTISAYRFIDSPWVDKGKLVSKASGSDRARVEQFLKDFERQNGNYALELRAESDCQCWIFREGKPYLPVFVLELPLRNVIDLAMRLATYLAQPANEQWDGKAIVELVA
jgi:hypothetical protein